MQLLTNLIASNIERSLKPLRYHFRILLIFVIKDACFTVGELVRRPLVVTLVLESYAVASLFRLIRIL